MTEELQARPDDARTCRQEAWQVALDRIELDVIRAERALETDGVMRVDEWTVPDDYGPIPVSLRGRAEDILAHYQDKTFSLTDALSFAVMERLGIQAAFSLDRHFAQFGWEMVALAEPGRERY